MASALCQIGYTNAAARCVKCCLQTRLHTFDHRLWIARNDLRQGHTREHFSQRTGTREFEQLLNVHRLAQQILTRIPHPVLRHQAHLNDIAVGRQQLRIPQSRLLCHRGFTNDHRAAFRQRKDFIRFNGIRQSPVQARANDPVERAQAKNRRLLIFLESKQPAHQPGCRHD